MTVKCRNFRPDLIDWSERKREKRLFTEDRVYALDGDHGEALMVALRTAGRLSDARGGGEGTGKSVGREERDGWWRCAMQWRM